MEKMITHRKSLLSIALAAVLLSGCDSGGSSSSSPEIPPETGETPGPNPNPDPSPDPGPDPLPPIPPVPTTKTGYLTLGGSQMIVGKDVSCNNESADGFTFTPGQSISCRVGGSTLATFDTVAETARSQRNVDKVAFRLQDAQELAGSATHQQNATFLVVSADSCVADAQQVCLSFDTSTERARFENLYAKTTSMENAEFIKLVNEEVANNAATDKTPTTHVPPVVPSTTPGATPDLNASFVSADAENFYHYQPKELIQSEGRLVDSLGSGIAGVDYYTPSGRGITSEDGRYTFNWGETVAFGIDTFELGSVRGNKSTISLTELGDDVRGANIDQLIHRYAQPGNNGNRKVPEAVRQEFAKYPNAINEIINLSLSHGGVLGEGSNTVNLPDEFSKQFEIGQAKLIDDAICGEAKSNCNAPRWFTLMARNINTRNINEGSIQADINKLWGVDPQYQPVNKFHVFHDSTNFYGSTGSARGQAVMNISNAAFPILMARNDANYWLAFGEKRAWDKNQLAYITEVPSLVVPENVTRDSSTFNLPFISLGQVGSGKLMVIGNAYYNSILRCPNGYSWNGGVNNSGECTVSSDSDDMKHFMQNVLRYMTNDAWQSGSGAKITVGTNIDKVYFKRGGQVPGNSTAFALHPDFAGITVQSMNDFAGLNPETTPLLILNGFDYLTNMGGDPYAIPLSADINRPKLTKQNVTDLITYMSQGGSVLIMESVINNLQSDKATDFVRLLDAAGLSMAVGKNVVNNGPQGYPNRPRSLRGNGIWVYERYPVTDGKVPYSIDSTGQVVWKYQVENKPDDKPKLEVGSWSTEVDGKQVTKYAFIDEAEHSTPESLEAAKQEIFRAIPGLQECKDPAYHYEVNCLEYRPGTGIPVTGGMYVPRYTELSMGAETAKAMLQAADLGTNIQRLYQHELYFRTKGRQGERLNSVDLERLYQNLSVWMWNDIEYRFEADKDDELGFKTFTEFLNCYTSNSNAAGTMCSAELKKSLVDNKMIYGAGVAGKPEGMMNPSYPLNYMEKPLTRLMLGRSYWDLNIKVDVEKYPGEVKSDGESVTENISLYANPSKWFAGNMQSTGLWAIAQKEVSIVSSANIPVTVTVALADDLTGREKHEVALSRPPRVSKSYTLPANGQISFTVPYGGLIYIQGNSKNDEAASFTFNGVVKAPFYKDGQWINDQNSPAPIGELESKTFVYTAPKKNFAASNFGGDLAKFATDLDTFSGSMNDFYGRDTETGRHRMFTYASLTGHKHRFTNDIQISIGDAHSGYPVMSSSFATQSDRLPTTPLNDWLLWHEVGHNAAEAPLNVVGATEVANNVLALYMQDRYLGKMSRVEGDIRVAPEYLSESQGQAWARGGAGDRLLMYAQLKEWAEHNFDISQWYGADPVPAFYSQREGMKGWNLFQLMHRKTRGDNIGDAQFGGKNYCAQFTGNMADDLMLCTSWLTQTDLSAFFKLWNPGAKAFQLPGSADMSFDGGISNTAYATLAAMNLPKPAHGPEKVNTITVHAMNEK